MELTPALAQQVLLLLICCITLVPVGGAVAFIVWLLSRKTRSSAPV